MIKSLLLLTFILLFSGCSRQILYPSYPATQDQNTTTSQESSVEPAEQLSQIDEQQQKSNLDKLLAEYKQWKNTPYRFGSTGQGGTDCSGFVQAIYKEVFHVELPRDSSNQVLKGNGIETSSLKPGDLVFYKINSHLRHVGIYVGNHKFMHSSTTAGVMISNMDLPYWQKRYWTSRRVLSHEFYTAQN
jgi:cell wall-associated NlpC family hydrolase